MGQKIYVELKCKRCGRERSEMTHPTTIPGAIEQVSAFFSEATKAGWRKEICPRCIEINFAAQAEANA